MQSSSQNRGPVLTLVKEGAAPSEPAPPAMQAERALDWSIYMARAQGGDRVAYRRLLEEITPYLRALAVRCLQNQGDVEDVVQDVLMTVHAVRETYDPTRPFGP